MKPDEIHHRAERFVVEYQDANPQRKRQAFNSILTAAVRYHALIENPAVQYARLEAIGVVEDQTVWMALEEWRREPESLLTAAHAVLAAMRGPVLLDHEPSPVPWGTLKRLQEAVAREEEKEARHG